MGESEGVSGDGLLVEARELAFRRYPGTPGDRRMIELLCDRFRSAGCETRREEFSYDLRPVWRLLRGLLLVEAGCVAIAAWLVPDRPLLATLPLVGGLGAGASLLGWFPWLERLYRRPGATRTANVEGLRLQAGGPVILLMAHHDSKSQNLTMLQRGALTVLALVSVAALALVGIAAASGVIGALSPSGAWSIGGVGIAALLLLSTLRSGNDSPGGVDNAGSLAILLALARHLPARIGDRAELRFLSPGAEEDHMIGALRYLDRHFPDGPGERPVYVINLDGAGSPGRLALLERYGFGRWFSERLSRLAREEATKLGLEPRGVLLPPAMGIDAIPFAHRGLPCLTLASGSLGRATLAVHSARDRAENLDPEVLEAAYRLASALALRLAESEPVSRAPLGAAS